MACFKPLRAWRGVRDRQIYWRQINDSDEIALACGQCIGCRLERSRQWAIRCMHEAKMHAENSFVTLTYNDESLPRNGSIQYRDVQLFLKRLRKSLGRKKISYYLAAEYGTQTARPHYHACLFGHDFSDKKYLRASPTGAKLWRSPELERLWPLGFSSIGQVTFETAAYVARYIMKKITGDAAAKHYEHIDQETGEITNRQPERNWMSKKPAIGKTWLEKYTADVYPQGQVLVRGKQCNAPRYYDKQYKKLQPHDYHDLKQLRELAALGQHLEQTHERLRAREAVTKAKLKFLRRKI